MIIQKLGKESDNYVNFYASGNMITFEDQVSVNLEEEEQDEEVVIPVCSNGVNYHRTLHNDCAYVAQIIIPPRKYIVEYENVQNEETGDTELKETKTLIVFDVNNVILRLWPILLAVSGEGDTKIDN
jgi:hypothetical protein